MRVRRVDKGTYLFLGSPASLLHIDGDTAYIVDPGMDPERASEMVSFISSKEVERVEVILTHAHPDHVGTAGMFGGNVHIHRLEYSVALSSVLRECMVYGARAPRGLISIRCEDISPTDTYEWGGVLGPFRLIPLPGHSPGHTGLKLETGVFYAGDAIFGDRLLDRVGVPFCPDYSSTIESMERVEEEVRSGDVLILSHGPVVKGDKALLLIESNRSRLKAVKATILEALEKPRSVPELTYMVTRRFAGDITAELLVHNEVTVKGVLSELMDEGLVEPRVGENGLLWAKR